MAGIKQRKPKQPPLRLIYAEAGSLTPNPKNWRTHPEAQLQAVGAMLDDPEIGWAGVILYNSRTSRVVDGHGRLELCESTAIVPVLVGSWSEDAEARLLARLDPSAAMAGTDINALSALLEDIDAGSDPDFAELDNMLAALLQDSPEPTDTPTRHQADPDATGPTADVPTSYEVVAVCPDEDAQRTAYDLLTQAGLSCRINTLH